MKKGPKTTSSAPRNTPEPAATLEQPAESGVPSQDVDLKVARQPVSFLDERPSLDLFNPGYTFPPEATQVFLKERGYCGILELTPEFTQKLHQELSARMTLVRSGMDVPTATDQMLCMFLEHHAMRLNTKTDEPREARPVEVSEGRTEIPELGAIAVIESYASQGKVVVAIGTTQDDFCITDPFSSSCGRFKADPEQDFGVTPEQVKVWWDAVQMLREDGVYDESAHNPPDAYVTAYLAGDPLPIGKDENSASRHLETREKTPEEALPGAAPELYAALKVVYENRTLREAVYRLDPKAVDQMYRAIEKAEGR